MKRWSVLVTAFFLPAALVFFILGTNTRIIAAQIDRNLDQLVKSQLVKSQLDMVADNPKKAMSSNPYDYVVDNANYRNIVNLDYQALPILRDKIANSATNGLKEYIMAIAAEEIAKVDLKGSNFQWVNAKQWVKVWDNHLRSIPNNVQVIVASDSSNQEKVTRLVQLGVPAIPFIMDQVEQGNTVLSPALSELLKGSNRVTVDKNQDIIAWVKENKGRFSDLRMMVDNAQK